MRKDRRRARRLSEEKREKSEGVRITSERIIEEGEEACPGSADQDRSNLQGAREDHVQSMCIAPRRMVIRWTRHV